MRTEMIIKLKQTLVLASCLSLSLLFVAGCGDSKSGSAGANNGSSGTTAGAAAPPSFSLAWSEYPSWSIFGVAHEMGLIDGDEGKLGTIEEKHNVDIVLKEAGYDSCLNMFTSKNCDAVCMTNMDALIVCPGRDGVAILPTSTSNGTDDPAL